MIAAIYPEGNMKMWFVLINPTTKVTVEPEEMLRDHKPVRSMLFTHVCLNVMFISYMRKNIDTIILNVPPKQLV